MDPIRAIDDKTWDEKIGHIYGPDGKIFHPLWILS
jgi:hypothetical protein